MILNLTRSEVDVLFCAMDSLMYYEKERMEEHMNKDDYEDVELTAEWLRIGNDICDKIDKLQKGGK